MKNTLLFTILLVFLLPLTGISQAPGADLSADEISRYNKQVEQLVGYLEGTLNFLGDPESPAKEKEIVINESYLKIFKDDKVQVEDDLDENRDVPLHKDVQAYLKDIEFFFKKASFKFHIVSIDHFTNDQNGHFFKVTFNRDLVATTVTGDSINSRKVRYMEVNLDLAKNDLRIASIYTTKINEKEEIRNWWNSLAANWRKILGANIVLYDSIPLSDIVYFEDSLIYISQIHQGENDTNTRYQLELPTQRTGAVEEDIITDTLFVNSKPIMIYLNGLKKQSTIDVSGYESVRDLEPLSELTELTTVNCSNTLITSLFPLRNLNKLEVLDCSNTPIVDLSPLQYSRSLKDLNLAFTLVNDLDLLGGLPNLEKLDVSGLRIAEIGALGELSKMKVLKMNDTHVASLNDLSGAMELQELDASGTRINNLEAVSKLRQLKNLNVEHTTVSQLQPLSEVKSLEVLRISYTLVDSLYPLNGLPNLKRIYWDSEEVFADVLEMKRERAIEFMKKNPGTLVIFESEELLKSWQQLEKPWKDLIINATQLSENPSKEELHSLLQVEELSLKDQPVTTLAPVKRLYNLHKLDASGVQVEDYSPISDALELTDVNLSGSTVKNLNFAGRLKKLAVLNIENTAVSSLEPLTKNEDLKFVFADNSGINEETAYAFARDHQGCVVIYDTPGMQEWWNSLSDAWKEYFTSTFKIDAPPSTEQLHALAFTTELNVSGSMNIISLLPITKMKNLEKLAVKGIQVSSLSPLSELRQLREIHFNQVPVADLSPLTALSKLLVLDFENTPVADLSPLAELSNLNSLNISGTQVNNLKALSGLSNLEFLALNNTQVKRLKQIENISSLKTVECFNTRISQKDVDRFKATIPGCKVVYY